MAGLIYQSYSMGYKPCCALVLRVQNAVFYPGKQVETLGEDASSSGRVLCPICRSASLAELNGVVFCPSGDLRLDLRVESLHMDDVR